MQILIVSHRKRNFSAIHCEWDEWVIGECSDSYGTGTRTNTRDKLVVESNGGTCTGKPTEIEECNTNPCPSKKNMTTMHTFKNMI